MAAQTKAQRGRTIELAESAAIDMRLVLNDMRRELDELEHFIGLWDTAVANSKRDPDTYDPRALGEAFTVERAMQRLEDATHIYRGATAHMNFRNARTRLVQLARASAI